MTWKGQGWYKTLRKVERNTYSLIDLTKQLLTCSFIVHSQVKDFFHMAEFIHMSKYHQMSQISSCELSKLCMSEALYDPSSRGKLLLHTWTCRTKKLYASKMQWWDRCSKSQRQIFQSKRGKVESRGVINPKQVQIAAQDPVRFLRLEHNSPWLIAPPSVLPAMALPSVSFSLFLEV